MLMLIITIIIVTTNMMMAIDNVEISIATSSLIKIEKMAI